MNIHRKQKDKGFTLVEILVAIVVVGILAAVVIIGIASLTDSGNKSACTASADAAKAAATVHFANTQSYPASLAVMVNTTPPELELPDGVTVSGNRASSTGWTLTMTPGSGGNPPTFACS